MWRSGRLSQECTRLYEEPSLEIKHRLSNHISTVWGSWTHLQIKSNESHNTIPVQSFPDLKEPSQEEGTCFSKAIDGNTVFVLVFV